MTNKPTELVVTQAAREAAAMVRPHSHNSALILAGERDATDIVQAAAHALRLASTAPASEDEVERKGFPVLGSQGAIEALADAIERGDFKESGE